VTDDISVTDDICYESNPSADLYQALEHIHQRLERHVNHHVPLFLDPELVSPPAAKIPSRLQRLSQILNLSAFERTLLLMCVNIDHTPFFPWLCARALGQEGDGNALPTIALAFQMLGACPFDALTLDSPIYRWQLVTIDLNYPLLQAPIEATLWTKQYLLGGDDYKHDPLYWGDLKPQWLYLHFEHVPTSYRQFAQTLCSAWSEFEGLPVTQLIGNTAYDRNMMATFALSQAGYCAHVIRAHDLRMDLARVPDWITYWQREALLERLVLIIDCDDPLTLPEVARRLILVLLHSDLTSVMLTGLGPFPSSLNIITYPIPPLTAADQVELWHYYFEKHADRLSQNIRVMASRFNLSADTIRTIASNVGWQIKNFNRRPWDDSGQEVSSQEAMRMLRATCRTLTRQRLDRFLARIETSTWWEDLVLPPQPSQILQQIVAAVEQRAKLEDDESIIEESPQNRGITCWFSGPSGSGKTTATEILANHLNLDLYRVDLSRIKDAESGDAQKHLEALFDEAEAAEAILLLDEADAILGADATVEYLLQCMAQYSGLAILMTHVPHAPDSTLSSRIQFIVPFDYPTPEQRVQIWQDCFPVTTPTQDLSYPRLAQLNASAMNIRKIAFEATLAAAAADEPVQMKHILQEAQSAFRHRVGRSLTAQETQGWG
jgi:ATPase family associated with various cellular activities (AAA)